MSTNKRRVVILGSTGSIGTQTLDVIRAFPDMFEVVGLASGRVSYDFYRQMEEFRPIYFHLRDQRDQTFDDSIQLSLTDLVTHEDVDLVVVATPGGAGI